jgi:plastocyanin domain-containing protein
VAAVEGVPVPRIRVVATLVLFVQTLLELTPARAGQVGFACGMRMVHANVIVRDHPGWLSTECRAARVAHP